MNRRTFVGALTGVLAVFGLAKGQEQVSPREPQIQIDDNGPLSGSTDIVLRCPVRLCAVCGRAMSDCVSPVSVTVRKEDKTSCEVYPEIEPDRNYIVCLVCMLRAYGVRV